MSDFTDDATLELINSGPVGRPISLAWKRVVVVGSSTLNLKKKTLLGYSWVRVWVQIQVGVTAPIIGFGQWLAGRSKETAKFEIGPNVIMA